MRRRRRAPGGACPGRGATAVAAAAGAGLLLAMGHLLAPPRPPSAFTVRFLDVGQGDATLIQDPSGAAILFDAGPPEASAWRLLRRAGVRRLAAVVATHPSRDHHGGLVDVLHRFPVDVVFDGGDGTARSGLPGGGIGGRSPGDPAGRRRARAPPSPWAPSACGCSPRRRARPGRRPRTRIHGASWPWSAAATSTCCCRPTPRALRCCRSRCRTWTP